MEYIGRQTGRSIAERLLSQPKNRRDLLKMMQIGLIPDVDLENEQLKEEIGRTIQEETTQQVLIKASEAVSKTIYLTLPFIRFRWA